MRDWERATPLDRAIQEYPVHGSDAHKHFGCVLHLRGTPPDLHELRRHLETRISRLPGLRTALDARTGRWRTKSPDLAAHVQERVLPPGGGAVHSAARDVLRAPLPEDAPPWLLTLLRDDESGRHALVYRVHHAFQDGTGMLHTLESLFSPSPVEPHESSALYRKGEGTRLSRPGDWLRAAGLMLSFLRPSRAWQAPGHRFSSTRDLECVAVPSAWLRPPVDTGSTRNDVFLAATARAVRDWADEFATESARRDEVRMLVPANVRTSRQVSLPGNRLALVPVLVPANPAPPAGHLEQVRPSTQVLRDPAVRLVLDRLSRNTPRRFTSSLLRSLGSPSRATPIVSSLTLRHPLAVLGAEVVRIDPLMCLPEGFPFNVLIITHGETSVACFVTDSSLPGLSTLPRRWHDALKDLQSAGHHAAPDN
ncbi:wax ester/triacylglycerol synthase domain-containing protein [Streptomyces sp. NPDC058195]|uniref:wax ester/triacylglycerol synthase domain-containing protein n=1 Tax=Streptomyces sp. NPDC058195 TaxID=3346375 RepID=UPI0036E73961